MIVLVIIVAICFIQVGERLNTLQQNGEVIGRLGGDEFLVVSLNNENADISSLRERIQQQIRGEYHLGDVDLYYPGASLGIVEVDPETTDADSALHAADIAMYQEKKHKQKTPLSRIQRYIPEAYSHPFDW